MEKTNMKPIEFAKNILGIKYTTYCYRVRKGQLRLKDYIKIMEATGLSWPELFLSDPFQGETTLSVKTIKRFIYTGTDSLIEYYNNASPAEGFIYIIRLLDHVKIGISTHPKRRISSMLTSMPEKPVFLLVINNRSYFEEILHKSFAPSWSSGEWFLISDPITDFINKAKNALPQHQEIEVDTPLGRKPAQYKQERLPSSPEIIHTAPFSLARIEFPVD